MLFAGLVGAFTLSTGLAQETICARVKIEIKQELTLERQAFDAEMRIDNTTDTSVIEDVSVVVKITDEAGTPVAATSDPNDLSAKFFVRVSGKENIANVDGSGTVTPKTTAGIHWLIIPAPGSAGTTPLGKKYLVGATLRYRYAGETQTLDVAPDVITVKPLPLLTLDYFLPADVNADDPLTAEIEPIEPFTLGVRVQNNGLATAKNLKIDSAQPKIIENKQGLLINFQLDGSYVDDAPVQNTLLIDFGDIAASRSKMGRWVMETSLSGKFTEFTAKFSHADELGGALTSILQAVNTHVLIHDVRVDLPGRDAVRDYLAQDADFTRVYESDGPDTLVTDRSGDTVVTAGTNAAGNASYRLQMPPTAGFIYARLVDPFGGSKALGTVMRSDAKALAADNVWLSKTRDPISKQWKYWLNIFDVNSTGSYETEFKAPPPAARAPVLQFVADRSVEETKQVSFMVEASSPDGRPVTLSAAPLPAGARFTPQAPEPTSPGVARAIFDWTPGTGTAGNYLIVYTATDGVLSATRAASVKVESRQAPSGPITPSIDQPAAGSQVTKLKATLSVQPSGNTQDPAKRIQFELYRDEAMTELVATSTLDKQLPVTVWALADELNDNTRYWWRARASDGAATYSPWVNAQFFVNLYNDPPGTFNLTSPVPNAQVATLRPELAWTNSTDPEADAISYAVFVFRDAALSDMVVSASGLPADPSGISRWTLSADLENHKTYYWKVVATDALGAQTPSFARPFMVNTANSAPTPPVILSPQAAERIASVSATLSIANSTDADHDLITYVFEIDTVSSFDSPDRRSSGQLIQSAGETTSWTAGNLLDKKRYYWRVKAQDQFSQSSWVVGDFLVSLQNMAPPVPTIRNPGDRAWVGTVMPTLEANAVVDAEGDAVHYQFEVYRDAALSNKVTEGVSGTTSFTVPVALADKSTHWWRARALDAQEAASAWSAPAVMFVSTGTYQDPGIQVTAPTAPVMPRTGADGRKLVTLTWEGTDPNIDANLALYYSQDKASFSGLPIVEGLHQAAGTHAGSFEWDVSNLAPGTYYIYGLIYDARGIGRAWAQGAVVIPAASQAGRVVVTAGSSLMTSEGGDTAQFKVRLGTAPRSDVELPLSSSNPREGQASPTSLRFTPQNWNVDQVVTVTGQNDCLPDAPTSYQVLVGKAVSLDPDYIGLSGQPVTLTNNPVSTTTGTTGNPNIFICRLSVVSQTPVGTAQWDYVLRAELTNSGPDLRGVIAKVFAAGNVKVIQDTLLFGAVGRGETVRSTGTMTLRVTGNAPIPSLEPKLKWEVTVQP